MADQRMDELQIEGLTSIRSARVRLGAMNVLVGANGAGKSNFIQALGLLGRIADSRPGSSQQVPSLAALRGEDELADWLERDCALAGGPELVNDHPSTAPSKRLEKYCPTYSKKVDGPLAIELLGVEQLSRRCPRFGAWLIRLGELATS